MQHRRPIKKMTTVSLSVRVFLTLIVLFAIIFFATKMMQNNKLRRESEALQKQIDEARQKVSDLQYEVVIVKAPFLYDLCKQEYIDWLERDNDKLPEEYWDEYRSVDSTPWGASEVYQWYSSGEPYNQFLICWPDRIAEVDFDWDWVITDEIIATTTETLQNVT